MKHDPIATAMDQMIDDSLERHAWLFRAGEQIRRWKAKEEAEANSTKGAEAVKAVSER